MPNCTKRLNRTHPLVRAKHDRGLNRTERKQNRNQLTLFKKMRIAMPAGVIYVEVQAMSSWQRSGGLRAKAVRRGMRECNCGFAKRCSCQRRTDPAPMPIRCIYMSELSLPENIVSIQWYLLTIREIISAAEVKQMVDYYVLRWQVEDTFRVLKTGCQVEKLRMKKDASLHWAVTLNMVVFWRIMLMVFLGVHGRTTSHVSPVPAILTEPRPTAHVIACSGGVVNIIYGRNFKMSILSSSPGNLTSTLLRSESQRSVFVDGCKISSSRLIS